MICKYVGVNEKARITTHFSGVDKITDVIFGRSDFGDYDIVGVEISESESIAADYVCVLYGKDDSPDSIIERLEKELSERRR